MTPYFHHIKQASPTDIGSTGVNTIKQVAGLSHLPGDVLERVSIKDPSPEKTPFRGYEDLKHQFFGPTILNKQRLWEAGDTVLYQGSYALPSASIGGVAAGPAGMFAGLALGKLLGQLHLFSKEKDRVDAGLKTFSKDEKKLLNKINKSGKKWAIAAAIIAGLGAGGAGYIAGHDRFGKTLTPILEGGAAASLASLIGSLAGQHVAKQHAMKNPKFKAIIDNYDRF